MEPILLRKAFEQGLFAEIASQGEVPWSESGITSTTLDLAYFSNRSGSKFCAPLPQSLVDPNDGYIKQTQRIAIAKVLVAKYLNSWKHLWDTYELEYNPIDSYDISIVRDLERSGSRENDNTSTLERTGSKTTTYGKKINTDDSTFGYNSQAAVPSDSSEVIESGNDVYANDLLDTTNEDFIESTEGTENETITKSGTNGVYTKQRLIKEDRELWQWNFFDCVFKDLDSELTLKYFDPCLV